LNLIDSVITKFSNSKLAYNSFEKKYILFYHNPPIAKERTSLISREQKNDNNRPDSFYSYPVKNEEVVYFEELG
jgi:hypothetical protein